ncbi:peptidoglycan DD-metalloendopeptidase family protein [Cytobacillus spongiae]|uniref:peptidoglycan DD-metalloendopeptidase family protein n=1 Tax=Cytobacillus spongiae TaxID=2901381 RepID=UPI001F2AEB91|nr:peptidoglycan DD-metalloendopeptidase family protein [Cytobacillus spongiae]UII54681.1 peptidoglycan DD-metalloendopeptidase family protein [Cytobacillus spongiae]
MGDYIKRFLIAGIMALCVSLLFLGGKHSQAAMLNIEELTKEWVWPSNGVVTDTFGTRHGHHKGIDIAAEEGSPIYAVDKGTVTKSYYSYTYGHVIFIKHENQLETVYAHLKKRNVDEGQTVERGDIIGEMGTTGDSSGVHLHFEVHQTEWTYDKTNAIDPVFALGDATLGQTVHVLLEPAHSKDVMETIASHRAIIQDHLSIGKDHFSIDSELKSEVESSVTEERLIHQVKPGDTLWSLAEQYDMTVEQIKLQNGLASDRIVENQEIIITSENKPYIVQAGDTLTSISIKVNVSVQDLMNLNGLKNDVIKPEQVLVIQAEQ